MKEKIIAGRKYLRISELAKIADVNVRTLQRWIQDGELTNFLTCYTSRKNSNYFRLGRPDPNDELIEGTSFKYKLLNEDGEWL